MGSCGNPQGAQQGPNECARGPLDSMGGLFRPPLFPEMLHGFDWGPYKAPNEFARGPAHFRATRWIPWGAPLRRGGVTGDTTAAEVYEAVLGA